MIRNDKIPSLRDRLDQVNSLDKEGLKLLYKDVRLNTSLSDSGGAGIGIIDIARKSENKLEYSFKDLNNQFSLFSLLVRISG
jgi:L-cysteine desulfidase